MATPTANVSEGTAPEKPRNIGPDGERIVDMEYYDLLEVRGDASDVELKKAYRKLAIKYHPDKARNDPNAEAMFIKIGEAYQVLSDSNLRADYNKRGRKKIDGEIDIADAGKMFSAMFGGAKFHDWVGEISLGKEFERTTDVVMSAEEKAELEKELNASRPGVTPTSPAPQSIAHETPDAPQAHTAPQAHIVPPAHTGPLTTEPDLSHLNINTSGTPSNTSSTSQLPTPNSGTATPVSTTGSKPSLKPGKLTPEQRKQLEALDKERQKERDERIAMLSLKLLDRIRRFVEAPNPGGPDDIETKKFEEAMKLEAEELKLESFGVEMCRLIGNIYVTKATTFLKLHRKSLFANALGIPKWWSGVKEKGSTLKEGLSFLSSTLDVQSAMEESQKLEEKGEDLDVEELKEQEMDMMGKVKLPSPRWIFQSASHKGCR